MVISNEELANIFAIVIDDIADRVAYRLTTDSKYGSYNHLSAQQVKQRTIPVTQAIHISIKTGTFSPVAVVLDKIFETRLRAGYEPNVLLRVIDAYSEEISQAVIAARPHEEDVAQTVRRRMNFLANSSRLHLANLNLIIPLSERVELDPELMQLKKLAS